MLYSYTTTIQISCIHHINVSVLIKVIGLKCSSKLFHRRFDLKAASKPVLSHPLSTAIAFPISDIYMIDGWNIFFPSFWWTSWMDQMVQVYQIQAFYLISNTRLKSANFQNLSRKILSTELFAKRLLSSQITL